MLVKNMSYTKRFEPVIVTKSSDKIILRSVGGGKAVDSFVQQPDFFHKFVKWQ